MLNRFIALSLVCLGVAVVVCAENTLHLTFDEKGNDPKLSLMEQTALSLAVENPDKADSIAQDLLSLSKDSQFKYKGMAHYIMGEAEYYREHYNLALNHYKLAEPFLELTDDSSMISGVYSNIGLMYMHKAKYSASLSYFEKSYEIECLLNDSIKMAKRLQNMGLIFGYCKKVELQNEYYQRAIDIFSKMGDRRSEADMALNLGVALVFQSEFSKGRNYYQKALEIYETLNDSDRIASVLTNLGYYHVKVKEYDMAMAHFTEAIDIFKSLDKKCGLINAYTGLGDLYVAKGLRSEAVKVYHICEAITLEVGLLDIQAQNLLSLSSAYKEMGEPANALRVYEQYNTIRDSIYNIDQMDKILEMENKYKLQKTQNQVTALKAENRLITIFFLAGAFIIIGAGVFMFFYTRDRGMKEKQRLLSLEQKVLRTQMNPHFIFNSLSAIQYYILDNKMMDAVDFLADFAGLMRMVLRYSQEEFIQLEQEREVLDYYINLQNKRFGDKVKYEISIDEELNSSRIMIPPMLAQPFIENSFEHGELCKRDDGYISVRISKKGNKLSYVIEDNGIGIEYKKRENDSPTTTKHKSLALKITGERLKLINNGYLGNRIDLLVEDRSKYGKNGTRVEFTIPLKETNT